MLVIDSSVAVKLAVAEEHYDIALRLSSSDEDFIVPSLLWAELSNALWKKARRGEIDKTHVAEAVIGVQSVVTETVPIEILHADALRIALALDHPVYDCMYLALAELRDIVIVTDDKGLLRAARAGGLGHRVTALADA